MKLTWIFALTSFIAISTTTALVCNAANKSSSKASASKASTKGSDAGESNPYPDGSEAFKLFALGERQMQNREFKKARDTFRTLAYKRQGEVMPMIKVAFAAAKSGDLDDSIEWAKKACVVSPKSAEAHLQLAHSFEDNQDWKAACLQYEVIYEIEPNKSDKLNIEYPMLRSLIHSQEYEKAEKLSAEWIKEYKKSADAFFNRAWTLSQIPDQGNEAEI